MAKNIGWVYGVLKHQYQIDTTEMSPEDALEELRKQERNEYAKSKKYIKLPKDEYAGLCSAIRTKFGNKIPKNDGILYKDSYYRYTYDKGQEDVICVLKVEIIGNEEIINALIKEKNNGIE